jgi:acyl carrier protein
MNRKLAIRQFIERLLAQKGDQKPLRDSDSLVFSGRLQSVDVVEVVVFLEEQWGIDFAQIGFDRNQFDSVDAIDALTESAGVAK